MFFQCLNDRSITANCSAKKVRVQRSGIDTIKYHTCNFIPLYCLVYYLMQKCFIKVYLFHLQTVLFKFLHFSLSTDPSLQKQVQFQFCFVHPSSTPLNCFVHPSFTPLYCFVNIHQYFMYMRVFWLTVSILKPSSSGFSNLHICQMDSFRLRTAISFHCITSPNAISYIRITINCSCTVLS